MGLPHQVRFLEVNLMDTAGRIGFDTDIPGRCHYGVRNGIDCSSRVSATRNWVYTGSRPLVSKTLSSPTNAGLIWGKLERRI